MEPRGVERRLTNRLAADIVGHSRLSHADEAGLPFAAVRTPGPTQTGENIRSLEVPTDPKRSARCNN